MGELEVLVDSMNQRMGVVEGDVEREDPGTIYKVLQTIREEDPRAYDPKIVSIGPFHHGEEALLPMEQLKWRFLRDLTRRHQENSLENYIKNVMLLEAEARNCYSEPVAQDPNALVKMMVLDGCFIIEFLLKVFQGKKGELNSVNMSLLKNDLLLLENQIPYLVLECLFNSTVIPGILGDEEDNDCPITLTDLAVAYLGRMDNPTIPDHIHHLLHLFHATLLPSPSLQAGTNSSDCSAVVQFGTNWIKHIISYSFFFVMSCILRCGKWSPPLDKKIQRAPWMTRSATELHEAGVKFERRETSCFLDVKFRVRDGTMEIPLLSIQPVTISQFRNLVAFEHYCPASGSHFTSYVALMTNLINKPGDVELLMRSGVLESTLSGHEEVAHFFNSIGKGAYLDYENHCFVRLFKDVKKYCGTEGHQWRVQTVRNFAILGIVALFLTFVATFFAVFSYFRPT